VRILLVDDMETNRKLLRWMLEEANHEVIEATNGEESLALFHIEQPDMVLLDIIMPGMDGYDVARIIKKLTGNRYIPIIFITAVNDDELLTKCLACGGDDFLSKPFNEAILQAKIKSHARIQDLNNQVNKKNEALLYHQTLVQREHEIVEHVFNSALSENFYTSGIVNYYLSPMSTFNGDVMLIAPSPSGGLYLMLGDFTGHGLSAAIGALPVSRTFFSMARKGISIGDIAKEINSLLTALLPDYMFCAATLLELNAEGNKAVLWCGGLPDAVLVSPEGKIERFLSSMHTPLGSMDKHAFERDVYTLKLKTGSRLYLHSDGVTEAKNPVGEMFGEHRLHALFCSEDVKNRHDRVKAITQQLFEFSDSNSQNDDISVIEILCKPPTIIEPHRSEKDHYSMPSWKMRFNIEPEHMRTGNPPADILAMIAPAAGLSSHKDILHTILTELYLNALEHGILKLSSCLKDAEDSFQHFYTEKEKRLKNLKEGQIEVIVSQDRLSEINGIRIWIHDSGTGFDYQKTLACSSDDSYGRGLMLIKSLCNNEVYFKNNGTTVEVFYSL
jgi:CheY-like chemotaxis protein